MNKEYQNLLMVIETLNKEKKELLNAKEYRLGNTILQLKEYVKHFEFKKIWKKIKNRKKEKYDQKNLTDVKNEGIFYYSSEEKCDKKIAVYTCITGNYDGVLEPLFQSDNIDYILFTNNDNIKSDVWKVKKISSKLTKKYNNVFLNRYIKMHPSEFLNEYDYSIYIDGNIRVVSDLSTIVDASNVISGLAFHRHSKRTNVYLEKEACKLYNKGNKDIIEKQIKEYEDANFPKSFGLLECNVIVSDLKNKNSIYLLNEWWLDFYHYQSMRDQLSLPYVLWKNNYELSDIGNLGNNVFENNKIEIVKHK